MQAPLEAFSALSLSVLLKIKKRVSGSVLTYGCTRDATLPKPQSLSMMSPTPGPYGVNKASLIDSWHFIMEESYSDCVNPNRHAALRTSTRMLGNRQPSEAEENLLQDSGNSKPLLSFWFKFSGLRWKTMSKYIYATINCTATLSSAVQLSPSWPMARSQAFFFLLSILHQEDTYSMVAWKQTSEKCLHSMSMQDLKISVGPVSVGCSCEIQRLFDLYDGSCFIKHSQTGYKSSLWFEPYLENILLDFTLFAIHMFAIKCI